eukprot:2066399-Pyramimonas_sp.AAC.1
MVSIEDMRRHADDFSTLLTKRPDSKELRASLSDSLRTRIASLQSLSAPDALALIELVEQKRGVASVKHAVLTAIDCKVANVAIVTKEHE